MQTPGREPKIIPFLVTGALIGVLIGLVLALREPAGAGYSATTEVGYLVALFGLLGLLLGALVAAILARRGHRDD
ncbi:hypothetical protein [Janibacter sp. G56]|uniref:hypothetical protein n=1 Tax=Janibacter sp. G56 TaxID=3418717 RepID=UPI003D052A5B